jgi:predicted secreted protein
MLSALSAFAVFFVVWWLVLFAVLPFGVRTQEESSDITLGTTESAPSLHRMGRTVLITTIISLALVGAYYGVTSGLGYDFDDIPRFVPDFR